MSLISSEGQLKGQQTRKFSCTKIVFGPNWRTRERPKYCVRLPIEKRRISKVACCDIFSVWRISNFYYAPSPPYYIRPCALYMSETIFKHKLTSIAISKDRIPMLSFEMCPQRSISLYIINLILLNWSTYIKSWQ